MTTDPTHQYWLKGFFSDPNRLAWDQIETGSAQSDWLAQVAPWLTFLQSADFNTPLVLPVFDEQGPKIWYGLAATDISASLMFEEVKSFVAGSYASVDWLETAVSSPERALLDHFAGRVCRISPYSPVDRAEVQRNLGLYRGLLARRPPVPSRAQRPFARVRADFDLALLSGNALRSASLLEEMTATGRINAEQRKCLEIRRLAGLGRHLELAKDRTLIASVADLSLPAQTIVDLVEALHETYVDPLRETDDPKQLAAIFKANVVQVFPGLFKERKGLSRPRVLESFLLYEMVQDTPDSGRCGALIDAAADDSEKSLLRRWLEALSTVVAQEKPLLEQVRQAILDEDYETALQVALRGVPETWAYGALLRSAAEVDSATLRASALEALTDAPETILKSLGAKDKARLEKLKAAPPAQIDGTWLTWARAVQCGDSRATVVALENAVLNWRHEIYQRDPKMCAELASILGSADKEAEDIFKDAFPLFVEFFVDRPGEPVRAFLPLYSVLLKIIAWSSAASSEELEISLLMTRQICASGPDQESYSECLRDLGEIVRSNSAPVNLDWGLAVAEVLAIHPTRDAELRLRVFLDAFEMCRAAQHRLSAGQWAVIKLLVADYGCEDLLSSLAKPTEVSGAPNPFAGVIAVYTLMEGAGQRAKKILSELLPSATIETNSDTVATPRLQLLAKTADVFVFAWKSSTHQAYYCAKDARGERELLMPQGAGTASLVRTVLEWIRKETSN